MIVFCGDCTGFDLVYYQSCGIVNLHVDRFFVIFLAGFYSFLSTCGLMFWGEMLKSFIFV